MDPRDKGPTPPDAAFPGKRWRSIPDDRAPDAQGVTLVPAVTHPEGNRKERRAAARKGRR